MSEQWGIENDTGAELTVRAPNGFAVELDANSADPRERFAYFAIRQQARDLDQLRADLAAAVAERDEFAKHCGAYKAEAEKWEALYDDCEDALVGEQLRDTFGEHESIADCARRVLQERDNWIYSHAQLYRKFGKLLAVIHRDGGHYESEHGTEKACADAELAVHVQRGIADGYHGALKIWRQRAEQSEARLAAIDAAPTVGWLRPYGRGLSTSEPSGERMPQYELIARPAKD